MTRTVMMSLLLSNLINHHRVLRFSATKIIEQIYLTSVYQSQFKSLERRIMFWKNFLIDLKYFITIMTTLNTLVNLVTNLTMQA